MGRVISWLAIALGVSLTGRAMIEPFIIDMNDPATYQNDSGGPSLAGVLAIHCGPGIITAVPLVALRRSRSKAPTSQS